MYAEKYSTFTLAEALRELESSKEYLLRTIDLLQADKREIVDFFASDLRMKMSYYEQIISFLRSICDDDNDSFVFNKIQSKILAQLEQTEYTSLIELQISTISPVRVALMQKPDFSITALATLEEDYNNGVDLSFVYVGAAHTLLR